MECTKDPDASKSEPDTGSTVTQDASGSSSAHCAADGVWCSGTASATVLAAGTDIGSFNHTSASDTASATVLAAGTDIGSFNHTSASDTASAIAAAATAKRWFVTAPCPSSFTASTSSKIGPTIQIFWEE